MTQVIRCEHKGCKNRMKTNAPLRFCYIHEHEQLAITPQGQHGLRGTVGAASWIAKLNKEQTLAIPNSSAGIDGYPYFTTEDLDHHILYMNGDDRYKPSAENVLDRYPIISVISRGEDVTGDEVAVIDGNGVIHSLDNDVAPEETKGMRAFSVGGGSGVVGIADNEKYQIIVVDSVSIAQAGEKHGVLPAIAGSAPRLIGV